MPQFLNSSQLRIGNALGLLNLTIGHIPQDSTNASHERRTVHNLRMNPYLAYISACANLLVDRAREERDGRRKHTKPNDGDGVAAKVAGGSGDGEADGRDRGHGSLSLDHHGRRIRAGDRRRKLGRASCR